MSVDYMSMSRKDLEDHQKKLSQALSSVEDREKKKAMEAAERAAAEHGFSLAELTGAAKGRKARTKGTAKYRNPEDPSQTWTGKGRRPKWIVEAEDAGRPISDFEIK
ncbi:H-NS family nucleoid-associated regulatory protein [Wenxinia saemankumensis]|uniref:DNA-binding protein H-NS n=1 Tax=Wenxinia saemankumensis TaxID=1447782 RepID=A0A1M6C2I3_9RHOB|nr:H-NS histone family protein [Wenxinia saemankumensis]SHI55227.1 DNA-binding protein H-NS [Wenxinia saemankumensis]